MDPERGSPSAGIRFTVNMRPAAIALICLAMLCFTYAAYLFYGWIAVPVGLVLGD